MNTNRLKRFAQEARRKLLDQVASRMELILNTDSAELREKAVALSNLKEEINRSSKKQVIDKVAYTWFNRLMALRFMDANDYQPIGVRVVSPKDGFTLPEILEDARQGQIPDELPVKRQHIYDLLDGKVPSNNVQNEVYKELLIGACNHLHKIFPFLFERINDYTELLLPDDLTSEFSIVNDFIKGMQKEDCEEVEVIGWLYQFYISELNIELISSKKTYKTEDLAPASQLFTPKWIVQYMVDNTLGQLWVEIDPGSSLTNSLEFYIKPADKDKIPDRESKSIEEVKFFEPCVGSGHILSYAFDVFYKIYEEQGYNPSEIPELIISKNLFGVDIDERAAQIASFVLLMKGSRKYSRFLKAVEQKVIQPNITFYQDFEFDEKFKNASAIGSLIKVEPEEAENYKVEINSIFGERQGKLKLLYDLLGQRYDVVVTNPPYISASRMETQLKEYVQMNYPATKSDLFATFILRNLEFCNEEGLSGLMTPFVWMFISSYDKLREIIIENYSVNNLIQLEYSGFDGATVPVCTFTLRRRKIIKNIGSYIRLSDFIGSKNQAPKTLEAIKNPNCGWLYKKIQDDFIKIPEFRFGYWLSKKQIEAFETQDELKKSHPPRAGLSTANNERFLRFWWEISDYKFEKACLIRSDLKKSSKWIPMTKGGKFRKWYGNNEYVLNFENDGEELKLWLINNPNDPTTKSWSRYIRNYNFYCQPGISFSDVSSGTPAFRAQGSGFIPNSRGPFIYSSSQELLGFLNSKICVSFLKVLSPTLTFNVGDVSKIPYNDFQDADITTIVQDCVEISRLDWNSKELSWDYSINELLRISGENIEKANHSYKEFWNSHFLQLNHKEIQLNKKFINKYFLGEELTSDVPLEDITILKEETDIFNGQLIFNQKEIFAQFMSYAVGCMFGRYSLDKEGLILANQRESLSEYLAKIQESNSKFQSLGDLTFIPDEDNIIPVLDDEYFEDDIVNRFYEFLRASFGKENFEKNLAFVEECLGKDVRKSFVRDFYKDHIKRYKKRPIYWMFSSPKGSFNVLIYMHRYTPNTLNQILNGYLLEYREKLKSRIEHLDHIIVTGSSTEQTKAGKEKDKLKIVLLELQEYEREILYPLATERIAIDLDDGVLVNYNKFGKAIQEVPGLNDKKAKKKVREFDWIETETII